jgi:hypothetical protein
MPLTLTDIETTDTISDGRVKINSNNAALESIINDLEEQLEEIDSGASAIGDLSDVTITSVDTGDLIYYDGSGWVNAAPNTAGVARLSGGNTIHNTQNFTGDVVVQGLVRSNSNASLLRLKGGSSTTGGGAVHIYGSSHASNPGVGLLMSGTSEVLRWSDTLAEFSVQPTYNGSKLLAENSPVSFNEQTGTSYTLDIDDAGKVVIMSNNSSNTVTIPTNSVEAFPVGAQVIILRTGNGETTIEADTGVTLNGVSNGSTKITAKYGAAMLQKIDTDTWICPSSGTEETFVIALSDETSDLTTGTAKATFRMPFAMTVTEVKASVATAPTGSALTVDINEGGNSILSTKLSIDAGEKTSTTAATPAVISDSSLAEDAEISFDIDAVGSTTPGKGLKVTLKGYRT